MRTLTLSAVFLATAALALAADPAPKPIPGLKAVQDAYDRELVIAKEIHAKSVKEARGEYVKALKAIQTERTKAGDLDGAVKVKEMVAGEVVDPNQSRFVPGKWAITHFPNLSSRTYMIASDGTITFVESKAKAKLKPIGSSFAVNFGDDKVEILSFVGNRVYVEHYHPANTFGVKPPAQMGWGVKAK